MQSRARGRWSGTALLARVELRRGWRTMVLLGVLAGLGGGVAIAAAQVARRTSTAYERLEAATGAPDAIVLSLSGASSDQIASLPGVAEAWDARTGTAQIGGDAVAFVSVAAGRQPPPDGLFRPIVVEGRAPDPAADDELLVSEDLARIAEVSVGDTLPLRFLTAEEITQFDTGFGEPDGPRIDMRIVGIVRGTLGRGGNAAGVFSTPAFAKRIDAADSAFSSVFVRLEDGTAGLPEFQSAVARLSEEQAPVAGAEEFSGYDVQIPSRDRSVVAVTARVLVTGLLVFGGIAWLAAMVGVALALRRQDFLTGGQDRALRSLGVTRRQGWLARVAATAPFVATGAGTAFALALVAAGIGPFGSLRANEPSPGWHPNWVVVVAGTIVCTVVLVVTAGLAVAGLAAAAERTSRPSRLVNRMAAAGAPPTTVIGTGLAVGRDHAPRAVPIRSALVAMAVGITGVVAVMVFASSLDRMVATPARWGWNADGLISDITDDGLARLRDDPRIAAVATMDQVIVRTAGHDVSASVYRGSPAAGWTILSGRAPTAEGEVLLGQRLARTLGVGNGDQVAFRGSDHGLISLTVVGTGTGPDLTDGQFGGGALITPGDSARIAQTQPFREAVFTFAPGVDADAAAADLAEEFELTTPFRPPDVDNLAQLGRLPEALIAFLALLSVAVLANSLAATARRRRRELDTLRAIGFVRGQARAVIVIAGIVTVAIGLAVGLVLGIGVARAVWSITARSAYVAGDLHVPWAGLATLVAAALVVAVVAAAIPARRLTRQTVAEGLRVE